MEILIVISLGLDIVFWPFSCCLECSYFVLKGLEHHIQLASLDCLPQNDLLLIFTSTLIFCTIILEFKIYDLSFIGLCFSFVINYYFLSDDWIIWVIFVCSFFLPSYLLILFFICYFDFIPKRLTYSIFSSTHNYFLS